jgi:ABC-type cobalamin/Fe3+-siderophores transport system ATPase subunit
VTAALLSLSDVSLTFRRGGRHLVTVLANASLSVRGGEVVSVIAQRAQGKTSLLRIAAGMQRPNRGAVRLCGEDVWELSSSQRASLLAGQIGWVGHSPPELDVPMLTSIAIPLLGSCAKREAYARATEALGRVGAVECAEQLWGSLADWERGLIAIAHAIAREPRLLLVDDVTAALDLGEAHDLTRLLHSLASERGLGVLMCVSDTRATRWSERSLTLSAGELLESGPPIDNIIDFRPEGARRASS